MTERRDAPGRLTGKRCLVTDAASGIGREIALRFAAEGARVAVADRDEAGLRETSSAGGGHGVALDVTDPESWHAAVEETTGTLGGIDALAHCAGVLRPDDRGITATGVEVWETTLRVNAMGTFLAAQHVTPVMSDGGALITMSSIAASVGTSSGAGIAYAASKGAVTSLTRTLSAALGSRGIRCNAIAPAVVQTPMVAGAYDEDAQSRRLQRIPLGRFGQVEDIASLAVYLASDESTWMTGAIVPIDGGATAYYV
jgi:NAD(P)-dependent dehydrogenase (short-subunit alcohol dehydrogenase family)